MDKKQKSKEHFNKNAENYDKSSDGKFVKPIYDEITRRVISKNPKRILDLGCGPANILKILEEYCIKNDDEIEMCGLDISQEMIKVAGEKLDGKAELKIGDAEEIPWPENNFDLIICNASFHHYTNPLKALNEINRVLKPEGCLILGDPTFPQIKRKILNFILKFHSDNGDHHVYDQKEIENLFEKSGFEPQDFKTIENKMFCITGQKL